MKIEKVIVSTNSNPLYFDFWDMLSYIWKKKMGIDPVLVYIDKNPDEANISEKWGEVIRVKSVDMVPEYLQTQWSRFFFTGKYPDKVCMTSDIDMFPLNKDYFTTNLNSIRLDDNSHVHLNANGVTGRFDDWVQGNCNLSVCYHVNYGKAFGKVFEMLPTWEEEIVRLNSLNLGKDQSMWAPHLKGMNNWGAEEDYTTNVLRKKVSENKIKFIYTGMFNHRFDRTNWETCNAVKDRYSFKDCHSLRPYKDHEKEIKEVLSYYHGDLNV
jgi:hypothetical protein